MCSRVRRSVCESQTRSPHCSCPPGFTGRRCGQSTASITVGSARPTDTSSSIVDKLYGLSAADKRQLRHTCSALRDNALIARACTAVWAVLKQATSGTTTTQAPSDDQDSVALLEEQAADAAIDWHGDIAHYGTLVDGVCAPPVVVALTATCGKMRQLQAILTKMAM